MSNGNSIWPVSRVVASAGRGLLAAACLWGGGAMSAWAANAADLTVTVDVRPASSVSVSRDGLSSYVAYKVKLVNSSSNTVNQVAFTATTVVVPTAAGAGGMAGYAAFVNLGSASPNCAAPPATGPYTTTSVACQIGQMKSAESREFFLLFQSPPAGLAINFNGHTDFSEGNSSNAPPSNYTQNVDRTTALTTIETSDVNSSVKTTLAPKGGNFFTGPLGLVSASNPVTTKVDVPASSIVTDNSVQQLVDGATSACAPGVDAAYFCYGLHSTIDINNARDDTKAPDFTYAYPDSYLKITFRQDASSLTAKRPVPSIGSVKIFYTPDGSTTMQLVPSCAVVGAPTHDHPCVFERNDFIKGSKGYYEYVLHAVDNGKFSW